MVNLEEKDIRSMDTGPEKQPIPRTWTDKPCYFRQSLNLTWHASQLPPIYLQHAESVFLWAICILPTECRLNQRLRFSLSEHCTMFSGY